MKLQEVAATRYQVTVNVHDAKTNFSRLLERAHAGQEVILAKAGKPYARMGPLAPAPNARVPGRLAGLALAEAFFDALGEDELDAWNGA